MTTISTHPTACATRARAGPLAAASQPLTDSGKMGRRRISRRAILAGAGAFVVSPFAVAAWGYDPDWLVVGRYAVSVPRLDRVTRVVQQGLRITIAKLGYMGSFVSRSNPDFCRTVLRLSDSVVTNTAYCYLRNII